MDKSARIWSRRSAGDLLFVRHAVEFAIEAPEPVIEAMGDIAKRKGAQHDPVSLAQLAERSTNWIRDEVFATHCAIDGLV